MAGIINRSYYAASEQGRQDAQAAQVNALRAQAMRNDLEQENVLRGLKADPNTTPEQFARAGATGIASTLQNLQPDRAAQAKEWAMQMTNAARYAAQAPAGQTKQFIERNFPFLVETYGPEWATASDEQVRQELAGIGARFAVQAGIGPADPKQRGPSPLYKYVDPKTGKPVYGDADTAYGKAPYQPEPAGYAPPRGYRFTADGGLEPIPGGPADPSAPPKPTQNKPPTEGDKRARVMYRSMQNAEKQLDAVTASDTSDLGQAILGKVSAGKVLQSDDYKRYEAAGLRWAANLLYLKSGATATPDEIRNTWLQFFPQPGDGQAVKDQKNEARAQEAAAIQEAYGFDQGGQSPYTPPTPGSAEPKKETAAERAKRLGL